MINFHVYNLLSKNQTVMINFHIYNLLSKNQTACVHNNISMIRHSVAPGYL